MLKCCKNKNSYDMKIYFHSVKVTLYLIKHIFIISLFSWYQNMSLFNQNKFVFNKIYFHYITLFFHGIKIYFYSVKINLYSVRNTFCHIYFFHSSKIYFHYINFSLNTFLVSMSGLPFVFTKVRILLSVCKLNNNMRI